MRTEKVLSILNNKLFLIIGGILFLIPFFWFSNKQIIAGGETYSILNPTVIHSMNMFTWDQIVGFGLPNINIASQVYSSITFILSFIFSISIIQKIFFGLSFSLSFFAFYYFFKYFFKDNKNYKYAYLIGAIFYSINPFILMMLPWFPTYSFLFILTPLIIKYIIQYLREGKGLIKIVFLSILLSSLSSNISILGVALMLILAFMIAELVINKVSLKRILIIFPLILFCNMFWILPLTQTYKSMFGGAVVYPTNFATTSIYSNPVLNSLTLNEYYWFDKIDANGNPYYSYSSYYKILSPLIILSLLILIVVGLIIDRNKNNIKEIDKKYVLFFLILFLFGIFFTKGTAEPFGFIYEFLLKHLKIFGIYRSSDIKFPYINVFALSFLIPYSLVVISKIKSKLAVFVQYVFLPILLILCSLPFILGQLFTGNYKIQVPKYWEDASYYLNNQHDTGRILLLPKNFSSSDIYKWGFDGAWLSTQLINESSIAYTIGYGSSVQEQQFNEINNAYNSLENNDYNTFFELLKRYNISYILIRNDFNIKSPENIVSYGSNYDFYENGNANKIIDDNLKNKKTFGELTLYETGINDNLINSGNNPVTFNEINPTKYLVSVKSASKNYELDFLESFDNNWQLYLNGKKITDSLATHNIKYNYANSWNIDVNSLCYNNPSCVKNLDGSYNFDLVVEFWPQRLFYLGLIVSGTTLLGCFGYLGWEVARRKKRKKIEKSEIDNV